MSSFSHTQEDSGTASFRFPPELVEEILLRLPAESLVRFKLVCKSWHALINDRSFASKHLRINSQTKRISSSVSLILMWSDVKLSFLIEPPPVAQGVSLISIKDDGSRDGETIACDVSEPDLPLYFKTKVARVDFDSLVVMSTANGIICLSGVDRSHDTLIALCNPVLKRVKRFPQPVVDRGVYPYTVEGLEYDSIADDYKLLRFYSASRRREQKAFVYSLLFDSWREIKIDNFNIFKLSSEAAYCGGVSYWRSIVSKNSKDMIVAFDIHEETFRGISLPDGIRKAPLCWNRPAVWKDRVVVFNLIENRPESTVFEMWTMVDDKLGGRPSWTKHLTIGPLENTEHPLKFWNDEELLMATVERDIVSYNLSTKRLRKLPIGDAVPQPAYHHFQFYSGSLVSLKSRNAGNTC